MPISLWRFLLQEHTDSMNHPLLELDDVGRRFRSGAGELDALKQLNLRIQAGEMLAIVGASGSGKSTLMNILGCLDHPSSGCYRVNGVDVATLAPDALAHLRRDHFGFVFQRYHLLAHLNALDNVAMPAVYAGLAPAERRQRARELLCRLGLEAQQEQSCQQLSGGQQQRVSIARALMNGGAVILADEPTGALDRQSGQEVLALLRELNRAGHTVIIITHDAQVAARADRIIELSDGVLVSDSGVLDSSAANAATLPLVRQPHAWTCWLDALNMALFSLRANGLRSVLTMLGIVIGIASVVSIVALGQGARDAVLKDIRAIGTNTILVVRGQDWGDDKANSVQSLLPGDLAALEAIEHVDSVTPETRRSMRLRWKNADLDGYVYGAGRDIFRVQGSNVELGRSFNAEDIRLRSQVVVLDPNARRKLFGTRQNVLGEVVLVGNMPAEVIGVVGKSRRHWTEGQVSVWVPYSTAASRLFGQAHFDLLTVRARDGIPMRLLEQQLTRVLTLRHGGKDFFTDNLDRIYQSMNRITHSLSLLLSAVALISLLVGGIGVMNIMLVSIAERTREIGIRMAVGARQRDVMRQFLMEAVLMCLLGGVLGVLLAGLLAWGGSALIDAFTLKISLRAVLLAIVCATLTGVLSGLLPARNASRLDPVQALARE
jgi:macrolide transport system ATP-binding/permease protein